MPDEVASILMDVYEGSSFKVRTAGGLTEEIPQERGVKQGCPISPLVFNLAIEGLIRGIESSSSRGYSFSDGLEVKSLAYANDLAIASLEEEDIKAMLARFGRVYQLGPPSVQCDKVCIAIHNLPKGGTPILVPTPGTGYSSDGMGGPLQASGCLARS